METKENAKKPRIEASLEKHSTLEKFKEHMATMDQASLSEEAGISEDPRLKLAKYIHQNKGKPLTEQQWHSVYFALFSLAGAQSLGYVQTNYPDVMQVLQENWGDFDPSLQRLITEFGFFPNDKVEIIKPVSPEHTTIVFGGGLNGFTYEPNAYLVNLFSTADQIKDVESFDNEKFRAFRLRELKEGTPVDMVADMNNSEQLESLPTKHFAQINVENVPPQDYWNPQFFQNAKRILRDDGTLFINTSTANIMEEEPYNIADYRAYFERNGFHLVSIGSCNSPTTNSRRSLSQQCFHLKKKHTGKQN